MSPQRSAAQIVEHVIGSHHCDATRGTSIHSEAHALFYQLLFSEKALDEKMRNRFRVCIALSKGG